MEVTKPAVDFDPTEEGSILRRLIVRKGGWVAGHTLPGLVWRCEPAVNRG